MLKSTYKYLVMIFIIVFSILGGLLLLFFLMTFIPYLLAFYNERKNKPRSMEPIEGEQFESYREYMKDLIALAVSIKPTEEVYIKSFDNKKLFGRIYIHSLDRPWVIEVHGYKGCGLRDFAGGLPELYNRGFNILLIDHRGHGGSEGRTITFGIKEHKDVISWVNYLNDKYDKPEIFMYGISMGGNTVLLLNKDNLPSNVRGIISDCPYTNAKEVVLNTVKDMKLPPKLMYPFLYLGALFYGHFKLSDGDAAKSVKKLGFPILIIHGMEDKLVPNDMVERLKEANPDMITLLQLEGSPHGINYIHSHLKVDTAVTNYFLSRDPKIKESINLDVMENVIDPKTFVLKD